MRRFSVVFMCLVGLMWSCKKENSTTTIPPIGPDQAAPTLAYQFVSVAATMRFVPFGDTLPNNSVNLGYKILLSDTNTAVLAACPGIVSSIVNDTSGGNIITIKFKSNSVYSCIYGGVNSLRVHVSDSIGGGAILGKITGTGLIDFQLLKSNNTALCPQSYGSPGFNTAMAEAVFKNNQFYPNDSVNNACKALQIAY